MLPASRVKSLHSLLEEMEGRTPDYSWALQGVGMEIFLSFSRNRQCALEMSESKERVFLEWVFRAFQPLTPILTWILM